MLLSLTRLDGPDCPKCGCADSTVIATTTRRGRRVEGYFGQRKQCDRVRCNFCGKIWAAPPKAE
ncbi:MAG: hypothetical protein HQ567_03775 [Candidatus Nealsonbacteria bacterium]|nr:hypothetical protein [Candidatus Nealsonbacteria bacterium]